jgi:hypothetical protein
VNEKNVQRLRREEIAKRLVDKMQSWYEIQPEGKDVILKCTPHCLLSTPLTTSTGKVS